MLRNVIVGWLIYRSDGKGEERSRGSVVLLSSECEYFGELGILEGFAGPRPAFVTLDIAFFFPPIICISCI